MKTNILKCLQCGQLNRVKGHSPSLRPICGRCGNPIRTKSSISHEHSFALLAVMLIGIASGIVITPSLLKKDFSSLLEAEQIETKLLREQLEIDYLAKQASLEDELSVINPLKLRNNASESYQGLFEARKSHDKRFALSPREKSLLQLYDLINDPSKTYRDLISEVARESSPKGAEIRVEHSSSNFSLHVDFDMSSMTSGEHGTQTKHDTIESLRKEVKSLISRVTNDIYLMCMDIDLSEISVGCRHHVKIIDDGKAVNTENLTLYKIRIKKEMIQDFTGNPFLGYYSTENYFEVIEDNFGTIEIIRQRL